MICLFRRISAYMLFSMIALCLFVLTCLICWDNLSIVEDLLLFVFHLPGRNSSNGNCSVFAGM